MMNNIIAKRIFKQEGYRFTSLMELKKMINRNSNRKMLDFGIGEQDCGAPKEVIDILNKESLNPLNHIYSDNGIEEFKRAISNYYFEEYGLYFDPNTEINHCMGIKSSLCILPLCLCNPGDYVLITKPGYVVLENMAKWIGANIVYLNINEDNDYLFSIENVDEKILKKTKILYMNYPNNPTGQVANKDFYLKIIKYAKKYGFLVVNDAAYIDLTFDKKDKLLFMQVDGAKDVGVEVFSFSKGYNMTGFRIGYILGNKDIIKAFKLVKDNMDSGQYIPIQKCAIQALKEKDFLKNNCQKIKNRHLKFYDICQKVNLITKIPKATFYQFVKVPKVINYQDKIININIASDLAMFFLKELQIMTIPYDESNCLRFSMTFSVDTEKEEDDFFNELENRLKACKFVY